MIILSKDFILINKIFSILQNDIDSCVYIFVYLKDNDCDNTLK